MINCFNHNIFPDEQWLPSHIIVKLPPMTSTVTTLLLSFLVTAILDTTNFIHAVTLKAALLREGKLAFNSNIRLLSYASSHGPNAWYMNFVSCLGLGITYGALSAATTDVVPLSTYNDKTKLFERHERDQSSDFIDINGPAVTFLGVGILLQAIVSTYSLFGSPAVLTWGNCVLANAKAVAKIKDSDRDLCHDTSPDFPRPMSKQPSMLEAVPHINLIRRLIWTYCGLFVAICIAHGIYISKNSYPTLDIVEWSPDTDVYWRYYGASSWLYVRTRAGKSSSFTLGLVIQVLLQSFIAFGLHCIELLFNISRDEATWRQMEFVGSKVDPSFSTNFRWQTLLMMSFKALTQWVFGFAFTADIMFNCAILPEVALALLFLVLAVAAEYMTRNHPKGNLPAVYGNFNRMIEIVDDWEHKRLFWGDKGESVGGTRFAGTAGQRLADLQAGKNYCNFGCSKIELEHKALDI